MRPARSLSTRIFLHYFPAMCVALAAGFFAINSMVRSRIKEGLKASLHGIEGILVKTDSEQERYTSQLLVILSENAGLKAAMGLYREISGPGSIAQARRTVQLQLRELTAALDYKLAIVSDTDGSPIGVLVDGNIDNHLRPELGGSGAVVKIGETLYETTTVPINLGDENLGHLTVGRKFEFGSLAHVGYAALFDSDQLLLTNFPTLPAGLIAEIAKQCGVSTDGCEFRAQGSTYLALQVKRARLGQRYHLWSFQPMDEAIEQFTRGFSSTFLLIGGCGVLAALVLSAVVSRSVIKPLTDLVAHLRQSESTGSLCPGFHTRSSTEEVNRLAEVLNRAAVSIRDSQQNLESAYVEFVETMAKALDERDAYTAGHSHRVSEYSVGIAHAMGLNRESIEMIRIGAELHDIGKIGIPDDVLQKPGRLSPEEFDLIKQHPQIGKRILEKVGRFDRYLPIVELHHENHDGTGYPYGLKGGQIPLEARIVHIADVYDAITSDRAYRRAMTRSQVFELLERGRGTQFDPVVMESFMRLLRPEEVMHEEQLATA